MEDPRVVANEYDANIFAVSGPLEPPAEDKLAQACDRIRRRRRNALLILSTFGGQPETAYRIARQLHRSYRGNPAGETGRRGELIVFVRDFCKSAGTMLALGADRLVMSASAELGLIDVQVPKEAGGGEWTSVLTPSQAFAELQFQASDHFRRFVRAIHDDLAANISVEASAGLAARMTADLLGRIYGQIDPIRLGEFERSAQITLEYGQRLQMDNAKPGAIDRLIYDYPSHGFVIDREEAGDLFERVDPPSEALERLARSAVPCHNALDGVFVECLDEEWRDGADVQHREAGRDRAFSPEGRGQVRPGPAPDETNVRSLGPARDS